MEQKTASTGQSMLYYALLAGIALIVAHLILYIAGIHQNTAGQALSFVVFVAAIVVIQVDFRNKKLGGFISYGKAVKIGFLSILLASVIVAIYTFIYLSYINPGELAQRLLEAQQEVYNYGMSPEQEAQQLGIQEFVHTPLMFSALTIAGYAIMGIIISLITAIFVKKEEKVSLG